MFIYHSKTEKLDIVVCEAPL